ncbi:metalloregulator ArsR/SmtB family transcription factor [Oleiagrimonas sp.]|jgi:DNA-binding transcriptional ArsR family regulator|uniref:ArsR/SmtB family transcription factor n=1 Tax=Oleiagrimonas sp. TaxID=2010330 RepID=UPI002621CF40|nr:metalloregulator ArsR/SmtB family transcription factor [Oleiagrimonas sp.]MDA3914690.1 metalloregulator ArsR/SmtB family transcription factor [Oleiagrimonas sp.]
MNQQLLSGSRESWSQRNSVQIMQDNADSAVSMLKSLASTRRLMILCQLFESERSVNTLAGELGLAQSVISQQLALLRREGIVEARREAQSMIYSIRDPRALTLMSALFTAFCSDKGPHAEGTGA